MEEKIELTLNAEDLLRELEVIDEKVDELEEKASEVIEEVEIATTDSYNQVLNMARASWLTFQGIVRVGGGTISSVFRMAIGTTLGMIAMLKPIVAAQATTGDWVRAALGMTSIGLAIAATIAAQADYKKLELQIRGANMALHGIQSIIGSLNF